MTFPYPLTPEVRADLWRFFCPTISEEHIAEMVAVHVHPTLHPYTVTPRDEALLDTPFARAFVAWREERVEAERPLPPISTLAMDLLLCNKVTP